MSLDVYGDETAAYYGNASPARYTVGTHLFLRDDKIELAGVSQLCQEERASISQIHLYCNILTCSSEGTSNLELSNVKHIQIFARKFLVQPDHHFSPTLAVGSQGNFQISLYIEECHKSLKILNKQNNAQLNVSSTSNHAAGQKFKFYSQPLKLNIRDVRASELDALCLEDLSQHESRMKRNDNLFCLLQSLFTKVCPLITTKGLGPDKEEVMKECISMLRFILRCSRAAPAHADLYIQARRLLDCLEVPRSWPDPHKDPGVLFDRLWAPEKGYEFLRLRFETDVRKVQALDQCDISSSQSLRQHLEKADLSTAFTSEYYPRCARQNAQDSHNILQSAYERAKACREIFLKEREKFNRKHPEVAKTQVYLELYIDLVDSLLSTMISGAQVPTEKIEALKGIGSGSSSSALHKAIRASVEVIKQMSTPLAAAYQSSNTWETYFLLEKDEQPFDMTAQRLSALTTLRCEYSVLNKSWTAFLNGIKPLMVAISQVNPNDEKSAKFEDHFADEMYIAVSASKSIIIGQDSLQGAVDILFHSIAAQVCRKERQKILAQPLPLSLNQGYIIKALQEIASIKRDTAVSFNFVQLAYMYHVGLSEYPLDLSFDHQFTEYITDLRTLKEDDQRRGVEQPLVKLHDLVFSTSKTPTVFDDNWAFLLFSEKTVDFRIQTDALQTRGYSKVHISKITISLRGLKLLKGKIEPDTVKMEVSFGPRMAEKLDENRRIAYITKTFLIPVEMRRDEETGAFMATGEQDFSIEPSLFSDGSFTLKDPEPWDLREGKVDGIILRFDCRAQREKV